MRTKLIRLNHKINQRVKMSLINLHIYIHETRNTLIGIRIHIIPTILNNRFIHNNLCKINSKIWFSIIRKYMSSQPSSDTTCWT